MFKANYVFDYTKALVHVELGEELDYAELVAIREEVRHMCASCPHAVAIYDYVNKPKFQNFSLTLYRKINTIRLDIIINVGMNPVQRSFAKLVHTIKPASNEIYFADTYIEAVNLAKSLLPEYFLDEKVAPC
jgi:hypothetical protein